MARWSTSPSIPHTAWGMTLSGDWAGTNRKLQALNINLKAITKRAQKAVANKIYDMVVGHIMQQDLNWKAHAASYRKKGIGFYLESGQYLRAIKVYRDGENYAVGISRDERNKKGIEIWKIAMWMESGTVKMPARPLWSVVWKEIRGEKGATALMKKHVAAELKMKGYKISL